MEPSDATAYRMPAEWEPHAATWLAWPHAADDFFDKLDAVRWAFVEMMRALTPHERVRLLVAPGDREQVLERLDHAAVELGRVDLVVQSTNRSWVRDYLPLFVVPKSGASGLGTVKWAFNGWARYPDHELDDRAGHVVAQRCAPRVWTPERRVAGACEPFVLEGGAIDVDGQGTLLATERCLLGTPYQRNPGLEREAVEAALARYLGIGRVIWLPDGIVGDDTSGHVDDFVRFVGPAQVVVCSEPHSGDGNHEALRRAHALLARARDHLGRRLELVELPMPRPLYFRGERLPASYANFYVANATVLVPTFNDPADRRALQILEQAFPSRCVVGIHCSDLVVGLGAVHCSTQQEPSVGSSD